MRYLAVLLLPVICGGCFARNFLDMEGFERATIADRDATRAVGADAKAKLSVKPGEKHYIQKGFEGRQVHMFSDQRNRTTVISGDALRKGQIQIIAVYPGAPPPPRGWKPK